jgi:hypothetical protein
MTTTNNFAWYYVGVLTLLLLGQQALMSNAQTEAVAKLTKQHQEQLAKAGIAPAPTTVAAATTPAAATPAAATPAAAPAPAAPAKPMVAATPTPVPAAAAAPVTSAPPKESRTTVIAAKDEPAKTEGKTIFASAPKPASAKSGKALPVRITYRSEPFKKGKIVMLANTSKEKLNCNVNVTRPATGQTQTFKVSVAPSTEMRLAGAQGWAFKSGDKIEVAQTGFAPKSGNVP